MPYELPTLGNAPAADNDGHHASRTTPYKYNPPAGPKLATFWNFPRAMKITVAAILDGWPML